MYTTFLEEYHMGEGGDKFKGIAIAEILGDDLGEISYDDDTKKRTNKIRVVKKNLKDETLSYEANLDKLIAYIHFEEPESDVEKEKKDKDIDNKKRNFRCIYINEAGNPELIGDVFTGKKPKQAASKACTYIYNQLKKIGIQPEKIIYCIQEEDKKKKYYFEGRRVLLDTPEEVTLNRIDPETGINMVIKYTHNNDVHRLADLTSHEYKVLAEYC
jgi:hypothetical protein